MKVGFFISCFFYSLSVCSQSDTVSHRFSSKISDKWLGYRTSMEDKGIVPEVIYIFLPMTNLRGGNKTGSVWMSNLDLSVTFHLDKLINRKGLTFFLYGLGNHGAALTPLTGDAQVLSSIEAPDHWQLYEAWVQQNFSNNKISILAGKYDLNAEFDFIRPGLLFLNSSFGIGIDYSQSGKSGPSIFPYTSLATRVAYRPGQRFKVQAMVADADPEYPGGRLQITRKQGALLATELWFFHMLDKAEVSDGSLVRQPVSRRNRAGRSSVATHSNRITFGAWAYTSRFFDLEDSILGRPFRNAGMYISVQQYFFKNNKDHYLAGFVRGGFSNNRFNRFGSSVTGGITSKNRLFKNMQTRYGMGFTHARNSTLFTQLNEQAGMPVSKAETAIEITMALSVLPSIVVQPNLQWVIHPNTNPLLKNALVASLMVEIIL